MAQIQQRGNNSYFITVNLGRDIHGKKVRQTMTYTPTATTPKQIEKEVQRQAVLFEEQCKGGKTSSAVKFQTYAEDWLANVAPLRQNEGSLAHTQTYAKRAFKAFGHKRIDRITTADIQAYVTELRNGERSDTHTTKTGQRSATTIRNYISFVSVVFNHAVKMGKAAKNPCLGVELPQKDEQQEQRIYSQAEMQRILELLHREPDKHFDFKLYFMTMIYTGFARQELLGLEYKDFDFERSTVTTRRGSKYRAKRGIYTGTLKNKYRYRTLKLPAELLSFVLAYKEHQAKYAKSIGNKWVTKISGLGDKPTENDRLFTQWDGSPMHPNAPENYFKRFCAKHGIEYINPHGMRHANASINIFAGVDVRTLQGMLGHSTPTTTLSVYTHVFNAAQAAQSAALDRFVEVIPFPTTAKNNFSDIGHQTDIKIVETVKCASCEMA
jgi:integrase